jgi:ribosome biogenesis GTPase / thiamine phosphate phosphatase
MIDSHAFERLRHIGLTPAVIQELLALSPVCSEPELMRVTEVQREGLTLHDGNVAHAGRLLPALRATLSAHGEAIAVGDWVLVQHNEHQEWWAHERVPPINQLARRLHDGRDKVTRVVIVSNVDTALLVMGLDHDFSLRRLERFVALAQMAHVVPIVVLTKADLCVDPGARLQQVQALLPPEATAVAVNALDPVSCAVLSPWLQAGQTLVLLGSSGTGKSTLTNTLTGRDVAITGANRVDDGRGRHTTTARSLHSTPSGACIIDTPGLRTLRLDGDAAELGVAFSDIAQLAQQCRFRDCSHEDEPGCAVRDNVSPERLKNYNKLLREARRDSITALERKVQVQQWKARGRNARLRAVAKRG